MDLGPRDREGLANAPHLKLIITPDNTRANNLRRCKREVDARARSGRTAIGMENNNAKGFCV